MKHYREIHEEHEEIKNPFLGIKDLPYIGLSPYESDSPYGKIHIQPHEGRHPADAEGLVRSVTLAERGKSLDVSVVKGKGGVLTTFEAIKRTPVQRQGCTVDSILRMRLMAGTVEDLDHGPYKVIDEEGWNEQGILYLQTPSGMQAWFPVFEYGYHFKEREDRDIYMVQYPLIPGPETGGILVNNAIRIMTVYPNTIEGRVVFPNTNNSYFFADRGAGVNSRDFSKHPEKNGDDEFDVSVVYAKKEDTIYVNPIKEPSKFQPQLVVKLPVSDEDKWPQVRDVLAASPQDRPHLFNELLDRWNTSVTI